MRRLAKQTRDDEYASQRDYQELSIAIGQVIHPVSAGPHRVTFRAAVDTETNTNFVGAGVYLQPSEPVTVTLTIRADGEEGTRDAALGADHWNRVGMAIEAADAEEVEVTLEWEGEVDLHLWGLSAGPLEVPEPLLDPDVDAETLNQTHLAPETYFLIQDTAVGLDLDDEASTALKLGPGADVILKKCSYCGRMLPLDPDRLGTLAFHKHNAKRTKHQNECRACKKWRINDDFNPKRTVDQLHESSVITRERKLFLREPERLQEFKDREGAGLKSKAWERFDRKCFYCKRDLELGEVQLDHTRPLAYLWPIDEHATCLGAEHNNQKTDRFPVDFYNDTPLHELSEITGLSYEELIAKEVNEEELGRIRADIVSFALEWEARTFAATARKVAEYRPDVDLYAELEAADPEVHADLMAELADRPLGVGDEDED